MNSENYNKFPVKIPTLLPKVFKELRKKNGSILLEIKMNWEEILEKEFSSVCFASSLKRINNKNILTIVSDDRNILELSYSANILKNKINNFFNGVIVDEIKFKKILQY